MAKNILSETVRIKHEEPAIKTNFEEFRKVVESRRSVRVYKSNPIPEADVHKALDMALLAPNSSNLQTWEFYWIRDKGKKKQMDEACLSQNAAKTAPVLIVSVARPKHWKKHSDQMLRFFESLPEETPAIVKTYYSRITHLAYRTGLFSWVKWGAVNIMGIFRPTPRGPIFYSDLREWSVKSAALACENLMLAFRALGYDTCPMEGFDEVRVKKILGLPRDAHVVMVISAGQRDSFGIYGPRVRFPKEQFVKII